MTALPANNRNRLQSNSAAVSRVFSDGNAPLTGVLAEAAYLNASFYADRHKANQRGLSLLMANGMFAEAALIITAAKFTDIQG